MTSRTVAVLLTILQLLLSTSCSTDNDDLPLSDEVVPESALRELNNTIRRAAYYQGLKDRELDSIKSLLRDEGNGQTRWELAITLSEKYRQVNADSAIHYADIANMLRPVVVTPAQNVRGSLAMANALSTSGLFIPAMQTIDSVKARIPDRQSRIELWKSERMLYSYMLAYTQGESRYSDIYRNRYIACDDSLLANLKPDDDFFRFISCERLVTQGKWSEAKAGLERLTKDKPIDSNIYGMAAFQLAEVYKSKGDFRGYARNLALSAESDIRCCVKEGLALPTLANWLYEHGDLDNAFHYINFALEDANKANIRMRTVTIAALMPLIDEAYRKKINDSRNEMIVYLAISTTLLLSSASLLFILMRKNRKIKLNENKLSNSSKKLEAYVGNFIELCSNYASRLEQLSKLVNRKISSGQSDDLLRMINSGKFNETNNESFYKLIDKALLDIFPDFVENINTLLREDRQVEINGDDPLTPELRIYAFVRLGVEQSSKIAQILNYSVNTVYAYRNRMRNRAINRDTFDSEVANLGNTSQGSELTGITGLNG